MRLHKYMAAMGVAVLLMLALSLVPAVAALVGTDELEVDDRAPAEIGEGITKMRLVASIDSSSVESLVRLSVNGDQDVSAVVLDAEGASRLTGPADDVKVVPLLSAPGRSDSQLVQMLPIYDPATEEVEYARIDDLIPVVVDAAEDTTETGNPLRGTYDYQPIAQFDGGSTWLVAQVLEGEVPLWGVANQSAKVVWLDDADLIPLTATPKGELLVTDGAGNLETIDSNGNLAPFELRYDIPPVWSAAFGPGDLLAMGLSSNQVAILSQGGGMLVQAGLPELGSPLDVTWTAGGSVLLVNVSAPTVNDSGIYACDVGEGSPCRKILGWSPELRLAHS